MSEKFNELPRASVDAIMIANARWPAFLAEHPGAVNTTIGVMIDPVENTPWQPQTVKSAREKATQEVINSGTFGYQSQTGHSEFLSAAKAQVFGKELSSQADNEILAYQSLGGTGALSLAKDILSSVIKTDHTYGAGRWLAKSPSRVFCPFLNKPL